MNNEKAQAHGATGDCPVLRRAAGDRGFGALEHDLKSAFARQPRASEQIRNTMLKANPTLESLRVRLEDVYAPSGKGA